MEVLGKGGNTNKIFVEPEEGERTLLPSSKSGIRSPSLDFLDTSSDIVTEDMALEYLAQIIANIYLEKSYGITNKESGNLLPGINQGTG